MRSTVSTSFCVHDGDIWTKTSVVLVVEVVFFLLPFQNAPVLICRVPSGIVTVFTRPLILASLETISSGAGLYVMCVSTALSRLVSSFM